MLFIKNVLRSGGKKNEFKYKLSYMFKYYGIVINFLNYL